jgi:hypothetical protein
MEINTETFNEFLNVIEENIESSTWTEYAKKLRKHINYLRKRECELIQLEQNGVDNWTGYGEGEEIPVEEI